VFVYSFSSSSQLSSPCSTRVHCSQTKPTQEEQEREKTQKINYPFPPFQFSFLGFSFSPQILFHSSQKNPFFPSWVCVFLTKDSVFNSWKVKIELILIWAGFWCGNDVDINIKTVFLKYYGNWSLHGFINNNIINNNNIFFFIIINNL